MWFGVERREQLSSFLLCVFYEFSVCPPRWKRLQKMEAIVKLIQNVKAISFLHNNNVIINTLAISDCKNWRYQT